LNSDEGNDKQPAAPFRQERSNLEPRYHVVYLVRYEQQRCRCA
jgi:hypothetical protein